MAVVGVLMIPNGSDPFVSVRLEQNPRGGGGLRLEDLLTYFRIHPKHGQSRPCKANPPITMGTVRSSADVPGSIESSDQIGG